MLLKKMQQYWMSILKDKKIFMGNYYICKIFAMILIVLIVFTGCGQNRITEKEEKKETVESEMNAEVKKTAQTFRFVYMKEKSELNTLKVKRKIINCLEEKGYAAVDCDNQIDMVNREKVEDFCKAAEKEEQAAVDIVVVFDEGEIIQYHLESMNGKINVRLCQVKWKDNSPQANYYDEYEAYEWKYTEKGYLFLEEYHPPGFDGAPGETGFRVQPLDKTCRELNRKYVMPLPEGGSGQAARGNRACRYGISVTWISATLSCPISCWNWRIDSRKGWLSMSPTVPPTSMIAISVSVAAGLR